MVEKIGEQVLLDKSTAPTEYTIAALLASRYLLWQEACGYLLSGGKILVETKYFSKKFGWLRRFYRGSKTICYLFPESEAFTVLVVPGQKEVDRVEGIKNELGESMYNVIKNTEHFHDGRWVWLQISDGSEVRSLKGIIDVKTNKKA